MARITSFFLILPMLLTLFSCNQEVKTPPWIDMFNKTNLSGWSIKGGSAKYKNVNGTIIGTTVGDSPNTFLTSDDIYDNFIMEIEFKVDSTINSGIQIRSNTLPSYQNGRVHGYQVEIDPSERSWSGGIYDEGRRGWLYTLENNTKAQEAFKQGEWNKFRVEAVADTIKTWINEIPASHLIDPMTSSGFIGLQVHSVGNEKLKIGREVMWRNGKIKTTQLRKYQTKNPLKPLKFKNQ